MDPGRRTTTLLIHIKILHFLTSCSYFPQTSNLSIFLHKQNFGLSKFFFQLFTQNIYTTISIKVWKPCLTCGRESGQVNSASVHNQHQYRTDCTGKLCFDRGTETEYVLRNKLCKHPDILNVCRGLNYGAEVKSLKHRWVWWNREWIESKQVSFSWREFK